MKAFKYSSSNQPTIRVVEMGNPHHHHYTTYNHHGAASFSASAPPPTEDSELSIFDAQKYFNDTNENPNQLENPKSNTITTPITTTSYNSPPPYDDLPASLPRRLSSSVSSSAANEGFNYRDRSGGVRCFSFPTASSEASWNSQTGLLANPPGSIQVQLRDFQSNINEPQKRESSSSSPSSWFSRLKCPCAGKKSVRVNNRGPPAGNNYTNHHKREDNKPEVEKRQIKPQIIAAQKEITAPISLSSEAANHNSAPPPPIMMHHRQQRLSSSGAVNPFSDVNPVAFSFPILNEFPPPAPRIEVLRRALPPLMAANDPPRDSLEVFQPQGDSIPSNSLLFSGHGGGGSGGRGLQFLGSPTKAGRDDDVASDASSDLFEIESFSTQNTSSTYPMYYYHRRDSIDEATTFDARRRLATATCGGMGGGSSNIRHSIDEDEVMNESEYCYEPSEASIDWSVTTAEGFDRASMTNYSIAASEMEEPRREWEVRGGGPEGGKGKNGKAKGMGLLSCRHEKAVGSMGPQPVRCMAEEGQGGAAGAGAGAVGSGHPFQFMTTLRHVNGRLATNNHPSKPPLVGTTHSARLSLAFAA